VRKRDFLVVGPQRVGGDVGHEHRRAEIGRGPAGSGAGADLRAVDRGVIFGRKARRRAHPQMLSVGVEQQNRSEHAGRRGRFDDPDQLGQRRCQRRVADRQLEHAAVGVAKRLAALVLGDVVPLDKDSAGAPVGSRQRLEHDVDQRILERPVRPLDGERHRAPDEGLAGARHAVEDIVDALNVELGKGFREWLADQSAPADQLNERLIGDSDLEVRRLDQRHESGCPLEHALEPVVIAVRCGHLVRHESPIHEVGGGVTAR